MKPHILVQDDHLLIPGRQILWKSAFGDINPGTILKELFGKNYQVAIAKGRSVEISAERIHSIGGFDWSYSKLGIDLGNTVVRSQHGTGSTEPYTDALEVIAQLTKLFGLVCIVSRVNPAQEIRARAWIQHYDFCNKTGIKPQDLHFCAERSDKAIIAKQVGLTHFIDDRPEVMYHLPQDIRKILFGPQKEDVAKFKLHHLEQVTSWKEIEQKLICPAT